GIEVGIVGESGDLRRSASGKLWFSWSRLGDLNPGPQLYELSPVRCSDEWLAMTTVVSIGRGDASISITNENAGNVIGRFLRYSLSDRAPQTGTSRPRASRTRSANLVGTAAQLRWRAEFQSAVLGGSVGGMGLARSWSTLPISVLR